MALDKDVVVVLNSSKVKKIKSLPFLVLCFLIFGFSAKAVNAAPRLFFDPSSGSYNASASFDIVVNIDTDNQSVLAVDAFINYDATKLQVDSISEGAADHFFTNVSSDVSDGRIAIYADPGTALSEKNGTGMIARISFTTIDTGTATVSFLCESGRDLLDSNIWAHGSDGSLDDVIGCASNGSASFTIGATLGDTGTPTATPTASSTVATATPTPSELPETGFDVPVAVLMLGGVIMLLLGVFSAI